MSLQVLADSDMKCTADEGRCQFINTGYSVLVEKIMQLFIKSKNIVYCYREEN